MLDGEKDDLIKILNRLKILLFSFIIISFAVWYLNYKDPVLAIIFIILGCWIIISSLFELVQFQKVNRNIFHIPNKMIAQVSAHIGIGLLIIGATGSSILKKEKIQFQEVGEIVKVNKFDVQFQGVKKVEGPNYISQMGFFKIFSKDKLITILKPEKRFYNSGNQVTTEAAIYNYLRRPLYRNRGCTSK